VPLVCMVILSFTVFAYEATLHATIGVKHAALLADVSQNTFRISHNGSWTHSVCLLA
jgi:hypothetical protein